MYTPRWSLNTGVVDEFPSSTVTRLPLTLSTRPTWLGVFGSPLRNAKIARVPARGLCVFDPGLYVSRFFFTAATNASYVVFFGTAPGLPDAAATHDWNTLHHALWAPIQALYFEL